MNFTDFQKLTIYLDYYVTQLGLKHNFNIVDLSRENSNYGWGKPDKVFYNTAIHYYLYREGSIKSFEDFCGNGLYCLEDWYSKFSDRIKI